MCIVRGWRADTEYMEATTNTNTDTDTDTDNTLTEVPHPFNTSDDPDYIAPRFAIAFPQEFTK